MSRVVYRPPTGHSCAPGWEWKPVEEGSAFPGTHYGIPPRSSEFPVGTVWECGTCGRTWVSRGALYVNMPGDCCWRREGWFARWRRLRRKVRDA